MTPGDEPERAALTVQATKAEHEIQLWGGKLEMCGPAHVRHQQWDVVAIVFRIVTVCLVFSLEYVM